MKPVDQTRLYIEDLAEPPGNCFAACLASLLELPLEAVPDELDYWQPGMGRLESWLPYWYALNVWLHDRGLLFLEASHASLSYSGPLERYQSANLVFTGPSPRSQEAVHSVVGQGESIAHDPHPSRSGLAGDPEKWSYGILVLADVSRLPRGLESGT